MAACAVLREMEALLPRRAPREAVETRVRKETNEAA